MRTETTTRTLYQFEELSDRAKENARDWYRGLIDYDEWWEPVYSDAEMIHLEITSFDLDRAEISGRFTIDPELVADEIQNNHGDSCGTYKTAAQYLERRDNLIDTALRDEDGEFDDERQLDRDLDELDTEFLHDLLEDYRITLRKELEYQMSDECIDENITANEYEFTEDGRRA